MGRAGRGGGGHSHSSGGHGPSRSSGGHRVGGGRAMGSLGGGGGMSGLEGSHYHHDCYGPRYRRTIRTTPGGAVVTTTSSGSSLVFILVFFAIISFFVFRELSGSMSLENTTDREKLETGNAFINECIVDELNWTTYSEKVENKLKDGFWEKTGVQPFVYLKAYDPELQTDSSKEEWAQEYYDRTWGTQGREDVFLYVYFAEQKSDDDVGFMSYVCGKQASSVMDAEAVGIFWNWIDRYWYEDMSTDDVITNAWNKTADNIMKVHSDPSKKSLILAFVIMSIAVLLVVAKRLIAVISADRAAKAAETERILRAGQDQETYQKSETDDLADKWQ